ncbi:ATP-binding cassette, subfamily B, MsbA [Chitinophaga dinghuensis]|uniref:ATP-binding cassette, subfamily B, MsbA n=1 Tax=Chitinophaga dinghuensis TaxID=1539050 RepID=A0A327VU15_9BACT|nr:ABC transporter ATP-binding protein [Chitinophaga dinghuensis]RAJ77448.1 ATP-binding cassette, subfamily B, MsbA [Chitinophaga dinghuensis]
MKVYFRLLSFARPLLKYALPYLLFTILGVIFSTLNLALLAPLLSTLFQQGAKQPPPVKPEHYIDIFKNFQYYSWYINDHYGVTKTLQMVCFVIIASVFLSNIFRYLADRTMENLRIHTLLNLRKAVFDNVMDLHIGYFNNERKGDIITKISTDVQAVQYSVTGTLQVLFKEPLTLIAYLVMLFVISYKLTLVTILVIPVAGLLISRLVKKLKQQASASYMSYAIMISYLEEALSGIRVIKAFNAAGFIKKRFNDENIHYSKILKSMSRRQQLASPVSEFLGVLMVAGIVLYGGSLVTNNSGELSAENFIAYIVIFSQVMRPAKAISEAFSNIHNGLAAGERVLSLIDEKPQLQDIPNAKQLKGFEEEIRFENVSFSYHDTAVVKNVSFSIPKGQTVALVGPSGAGKSTIMDLLPRFIQPRSGKITIDGTDIHEVQAHSLRAMMGIVGQDSVLFNDTIFNNIAFGKQGVTQEQVEHAARIANAHDFISATVNGYQTNIGDKGIKLSGGQRQRICIARAVLNNPPLMLLDEATSALDTESEKLVQEALNNLMQFRTSLVIAHRLSTIQNADHILVMDNGCIVEQGTHLELLAYNGVYRRLIDMQSFTAMPVTE